MKNLAILSFIALGAAALPTAASAEPFNGPIVGAQLGRNHDKAGSTQGPAGDLVPDRSKEASTGVVFAGYDHEIEPRVVTGAEAGLNLTAGDALSRGVAGDSFRIVPHSSFDLSARAGYLATGNTLVYARGGYANVRMREFATVGGETLHASDNLDGWMVGGGVERALKRISARLEYRYSELGVGQFDLHPTLFGIAYRF